MKVEYIIQNDEINLDKIIENEVKNGVKKIHLVVSEIQESGFEALEDHLIDTKVKLNVYMGVNKKNTTKALLENILSYSDEVYYYNNNEQIEYESNIIICEGLKKANIYITSGDLTEIFMKTANIVITKINYDLITDKQEFKLSLLNIIGIKNRDFKLLAKDDIKILSEEKIIFSNKQYEHNVKSISDFLGKTDKSSVPKPKELVATEDIIIELPKPVLNDFNFDIDLDDAINQEIEISEKISENNRKEQEKVAEKLKEEIESVNKELIKDDISDESFDSKEAFSLDDLLFVKSNIKLVDSKSLQKTKEIGATNQMDAQEISEVKFKKIDLNNITSYVYELSGKKVNGKDLENLKIPNYIATTIPDFFKLKNNTKETINGVEYKSREVALEIIDAKNNKMYNDSNAKIIQKKSQTYFSFSSNYFKDIEFEEKDIARIIKIDDSNYKVEIVSKQLQEYKLWSKLTNMDFRNSTNRYGFM